MLPFIIISLFLPVVDYTSKFTNESLVTTYSMSFHGQDYSNVIVKDKRFHTFKKPCKYLWCAGI